MAKKVGMGIKNAVGQEAFGFSRYHSFVFGF
jgi:hypothetical protein